MGLGPVDLVSLAEVRDRVLDLRRSIRNGTDPLEAKRHDKASRRVERVKAMTFAEAAAAYIDTHEAGWSDKRSWPSTMRLYVYPAIGEMPIAAVDLPAVLRVLEPIWSSKTESAKRVRGRIESILDWATVRGHRSGENPARWRGHLESLLAKPSRIARAEHHKALPYRDLPDCQSARKWDPDSAANWNPYQRLRRSSPESMEGTRARRAVPSRATERRAWGGAVGPRGRSARHGR